MAASARGFPGWWLVPASLLPSPPSPLPSPPSLRPRCSSFLPPSPLHPGPAPYLVPASCARRLWVALRPALPPHRDGAAPAGARGSLDSQSGRRARWRPASRPPPGPPAGGSWPPGVSEARRRFLAGHHPHPDHARPRRARQVGRPKDTGCGVRGPHEGLVPGLLGALPGCQMGRHPGQRLLQGPRTRAVLFTPSR